MLTLGAEKGYKYILRGNAGGKTEEKMKAK